MWEIRNYFLIVVYWWSLCPSSSLGRNIVPAQDIRAEPFRSEVRKTRNCLFLNAFLYLYIISLQKHKTNQQKRFHALFTGSICCFTGLWLWKEEIAGNKRWAYWNVFYFIFGIVLVTRALWVDLTSFLLWLLAATQIIKRSFLYPAWQICFQKPSYKMLVPLIKLFLELDAKDVAKYWDSAAQPQPLVAAENLIHRHLSLVGYVARGIYSTLIT